MSMYNPISRVGGYDNACQKQNRLDLSKSWCNNEFMDDLRAKLLEFSKESITGITPKELKTMLTHIRDEALEYYIAEYVSEEYLATLLSDIRQDML
jgi:Asp-tRNA(Asn)/Glu-tRNA(Gln) amidotransferase B subunit